MKVYSLLGLETFIEDSDLIPDNSSQSQVGLPQE